MRSRSSKTDPESISQGGGKGLDLFQVSLFISLSQTAIAMTVIIKKGTIL